MTLTPDVQIPGATAAAYQGDAALERLLRDRGVGRSAGWVRELVAGVAAAPEQHDPDAWMTLVSPTLDPVLRDQLRALLAQVRGQRGKEALPDPDERLRALREELARVHLAGFIVPRADEHQGEQVPACSERLAWLTGFTGSAGTAIVLADVAVLFVDGRYTVQASDEVDPALWTVCHMTGEPLSGWIEAHLPEGGQLGYDPWLHTPAQLEPLRTACRKMQGELVAIERNPVDTVWRDRPPPPLTPIVAHEMPFAGRRSDEKRLVVADTLVREREDAAILSAPASIAWLLNIRGGDVPYTPLPLAFAIVHSDARVTLFVDPRKLVPGLAGHLGDAMMVHRPEELSAALDRLGADRDVVRIDPAGTPEWVVERLKRAGATVSQGADPCLLPKAVKSPEELEGIRAVHRRDGAALTRFLAWLSRVAPGGGVTESDAADYLEACRRSNENFRGLSFPTISAAAEHAAVVHYRVTAATNRTLDPSSLYLVDSGGQYLDGTTDVTRTVAIGEASAGMRMHFTRVLKGHIALARARFPTGTTGSQLDALARTALWEVGLDYDHGTGHGVGNYLSVHEGPHRISNVPSLIALQPGMVVSNEPGYYRTGEYGIRIENLVVVVALEPPEGAERDLLGFETLTLAPIDLRLIVLDLLTPDEGRWLNAYHARVRRVLTPLVDAETTVWLHENTLPVRV
jgi:Xaa-Pro aminopeptidase